MKFENTEVFNFEGALRGMRNPLNSWGKSDSYYDDHGNFIIGDNDIKLAKQLINGGPEHRKWMRQVFICTDIEAPTYFMNELDTYKIGVTRNSTSFMHKGISKPFEIEDFAHDDERIITILSTRKVATENSLIYPYETDEFKLFYTENGREFKVYKNGRIVSSSFSYTDVIGRTRTFPEREVKPSITKNGYWEMNLGGRNGEKWLLHRLVAFVWNDNPNGFETVDHLNGNKNDNSSENLEWVSRSENAKRGIQAGLNRHGDLRADYLNWKASSKITPADKLLIKKLYGEGVTQKELAERFDVSMSQISVAVRNANNTSNHRDLFEECWYWERLLETLNELREKYIDTNNYEYFRNIRQCLPMSYLYRSTITMNYENLINMYRQRKNHKLKEWSEDFCGWVKTLPYAQEFITQEGFDD